MVKKTLTTLPRIVTVHWRRIVFGVLGLAVIAGAGYYFGFVRIYKSDYAHMLGGVNRTTTAYNDLLAARDEALDKLGESDDAFGGVVKQYSQKYTNYQAAVVPLASERALRDTSVQSAYDVFRKRNTTFEAFVSGQLKLLPFVQGVTVQCSEAAPSKLNTSDLGTIVAVYDDAMKACTDAMSSLAKSDDKAAAKRGSDNITYFDAMRVHAVQMQDAYTAGNRATFESEYNALLEALAQYKAHTQVRDLLDIPADTVPTKELNALAAILSRRQT